MVTSFAELARFRFAGETNAVGLQRELAGDFRTLAHSLAPSDGVITIDPDVLRDRAWSDAVRLAANAILDDFHALDELGREPVLNCITRYDRDERGLPISTDVFSFHADRAPVECDTWLCTYWGKSSEAIANASARRWIDDPDIHAALRRHYASLDDDAFRDLIHDESFDLHYRVVEAALPYSFGTGALWKIAVDWPGSPVRPCLHRAPPTEPGDEPRLLLIS